MRLSIGRDQGRYPPFKSYTEEALTCTRLCIFFNRVHTLKIRDNLNTIFKISLCPKYKSYLEI